MQALIFCLTFPLIPLLAWRSYHQNQNGSLWIRYGVYLLLIQLLTTVATVFLCDPGTSVLTKADAIPTFALKLAVVAAVAAALIALAEWLYVVRKVRVQVLVQEYQQMGITRFCKKYAIPCAIYLAAIAVILLNVSLMFDNVLWGDECFSGNTARKDIAGILQVNYFWDSHPPFYYFWLRAFGETLGHEGWVYHLASLVPFFIGIGMALTCVRKRFGTIPAAYMIIITGLASPCLRYNVEIRMYSLAFLAVLGCYYCAYRVVSGGKAAAWIGMVFWALLGAYTHYYALMAVGLLVFFAGVAAALRYRGKTWIKSVAALVGFLAGYAPWIPHLFHNTVSVSQDWWMEETMSLRESLQMLFCGPEYEKILFVLCIGLTAVLLVWDSGFLALQKKAEGTTVFIHRPRLKTWTDETYGIAVGLIGLIGTVVAAYLLCLLIGPVLAQRYLYPVCPITILLIVMGQKGFLDKAEALAKALRKRYPVYLMKTVFVVILLVLCVIGLRNYKVFREEVTTEKAQTEAVLDIIGEVPEDTVLLTNRVKHLGWTVLYYYFPHRDVVTGRCSDEGAEYDQFWYFTPEEIGKSELKEMKEMGYRTEAYGWQKISVYPFYLYYFEKE